MVSLSALDCGKRTAKAGLLTTPFFRGHLKLIQPVLKFPDTALWTNRHRMLSVPEIVMMDICFKHASIANMSLARGTPFHTHLYGAATRIESTGVFKIV
jgi:hypothetical protein